MIDCATIRTWIREEDDRSLSPADGAVLRNHLAGCPACATEAAAQKRLWDAMGAWGAIEPSPGFADRVRRRVFRPDLRLLPYLPVSAAAAAALLVLLPFLRPSERRPASPLPAPMGPAAALPDEELIAHLDVLEHMDVAEGIDLVEARGRLADLEGILEAGEER